LYLNLLPALNAGQVKLLDLPRLRSQLLALERRTIRGSGRDVIDHPSSGADDLINACAGALVLAASAESRKIHWSAISGATSFSTATGKRDPGEGQWPRPVGLHERPPERLWPTGDVRFG
jgi:hypothetical protein